MTSTTFLPLLAPAEEDPYGDPAAPVLDEFTAELAVAYSWGPPYGQRLVSWLDLDRLGLSRRVLRERATENLDAMLETVRVHRDPPALVLHFDGIESSLLLASSLWLKLAAWVQGDLVVGVPARDVVVVTGSKSQQGLAKAKRTVDRVFFAGDQYLLSRQLLIRREDCWETFQP
ncbi:DUF1444 family protein [Planosporangium flavigriseum]|uniref:DUF1444 family protein n=1 Tax=Planosporangium flavigriseum TaxID=373681 RepID=UPI00143B98C5|nr:DUF1444 family protein [Planosporangium flavigriseum]NJC66755.1 DUF1444 family protein [Planosporangium flavigriseum]